MLLNHPIEKEWWRGEAKDHPSEAQSFNLLCCLVCDPMKSQGIRSAMGLSLEHAQKHRIQLAALSSQHFYAQQHDGADKTLPVTSAGARSTTPSCSCSLITASYSSSMSVFLNFRTRVFNLRKLPSRLFGRGGQFPFQGSPVSYHPSEDRTNCSLISW